MVDLIIRVFVGVSGLLLLSIGVQYLLDPVTAGAQFAIGTTGDMGIANLRADMVGFFCGSGGLALAAAIRNKTSWLLAPMVLMALAFIGRLITLGVEGTDPGATAMIVEAAMVVIFAGAMMRDNS